MTTCVTCFQTAQHFAPWVLAAETLELLARGPEDFADDVELISWEQWLKESAPEKPA